MEIGALYKEACATLFKKFQNKEEASLEAYVLVSFVAKKDKSFILTYPEYQVSDDEIEACNCGSYGCLEQYTSATGIVRVTKRKLAKSNEETTLRKYENLTAKDVFDEAKAGDAVALDLVDEVCGILGKALSNIACVVDPEVIVIGGGVSKAGDILIDTIQKHFVETAFHACRETVFSLAGLGNDAGMYGCVKMLLD